MPRLKGVVPKGFGGNRSTLSGVPMDLVAVQGGACTCDGRKSTTSDVTNPTLVGEGSWPPPGSSTYEVWKLPRSWSLFKVITGGPSYGKLA